MTRRLTATLAALAIAATLGACSSTETAGLAEVPVASAAPAAGAELTATDFAAALKRPGTTVIDVRTPAEFAEGHLANAVNIDVQAPDFATKIAGLDPAGTYAVYCRSGNRSAAALSAMSAAGFTHLYHLGGGIGAWQEAGGQVVTG